jgi:hypothetical protein
MPKSASKDQNDLDSSFLFSGNVTTCPGPLGASRSFCSALKLALGPFSRLSSPQLFRRALDRGCGRVSV